MGLGIVAGLQLLILVLCCDVIIVSLQSAFPRRLPAAEVVACKRLLTTVTKTLILL